MKLSMLLVATLTCVSGAASTRAPLIGRGLGETVKSNYIVVLKQGITGEKAKSYYGSLRTNPRKFGKSKRGIVREFGNVVGMQAIHVECDEDVLDTIRQNPQVRTHLFLITSGAGEVGQGVKRGRVERQNVSDLTLHRWIMSPKTSASRPRIPSFPTSSRKGRRQPPVSPGDWEESRTGRPASLPTPIHGLPRPDCTSLTRAFA